MGVDAVALHRLGEGAVGGHQNRTLRKRDGEIKTIVDGLVEIERQCLSRSGVLTGDE